MEQETTIITDPIKDTRWALWILVIILVIVYIALYLKRNSANAKQEPLEERAIVWSWVVIDVNKAESQTKVALQPNNNITQIQFPDDETDTEQQNTEKTQSDLKSENETNNEWETNDKVEQKEQSLIEKLRQKENTTPEQIVILPWTQKHIGQIASLQKLGIEYQYILKDDKDIYYVSLGETDQNRWQIARSFEGNIFEIITQAEINKNNLFGESVTYINIPQYQNDIVLMVIYHEGEQRLIQVDYDIYHESKEHMKKHFNY